MIVVGGTLLLTPGFLTDVLGLLLLIPPTRAILRRLVRSFFARRFLVVGLGERAMRAGGATKGYDYEGTAEEADAEDPRLDR